MIFLLPLAGQTTVGVDAANYPYLLRLQHQTSGLDTCVLLQRGGSYHLERTQGDATSVFEGSLSGEELSLVDHWLNDERLQKLTRKDITRSLLPSEVDILQLNIFRGDHWQDLLFRDAESQKPFESPLAPLVSWLDALHHAPHKELSEDAGKNNCLLPRKIELKVRAQPPAGNPGPQPSSAAAPEVAPASGTADALSRLPAPKPFLLRFESDRFENQQAERTCVVIYPGAQYHMEKSSQELDRTDVGLYDPQVVASGKVKTQVYEGPFDTRKLQALQLLLDDPDLKHLEKGNLAGESVLWTTEIMRLAIFRGNHLQRLEFEDPVHILDPTGNGILLHDKNIRLIRPIQKWVKAEIRPTKTTLLPDATPTNCSLH